VNLQNARCNDKNKNNSFLVWRIGPGVIFQALIIIITTTITIIIKSHHSDDFQPIQRVAYPGIFSGGVQQIQLRTEDRENGDLRAVAP
jgi:hypothetical protein